MDTPQPDDRRVELFWQEARKVVGLNRLDVVVGTSGRAALTPPTWSFGGPPQEADDLVALVLAGAKTATSSPLWVWETGGQELPASGDLSILLDGRGDPAALLREDDVTVLPFDQVPEEHAAAEGEGDRTLEHWRQTHRRAFAEALAPHGCPFEPAMPIVLERFTVLHPRSRRRHT